ncbi:hypothetical protein C0Q70_04779 [Pomacea canaliculata]|uniref:ETS domain-containing protein n=1 Tax=Pomacea canaliculata TaxID=400727 RepID=A0A2T7PJB4_POMCA|nr:hypothetical protein C0Q70_04779 [Pomacea canaliculata]
MVHADRRTYENGDWLTCVARDQCSQLAFIRHNKMKLANPSQSLPSAPTQVPPTARVNTPFPPASRFQGQPDPSVSPSPSVSSTCSTASCSSSSNSFHQNDTNDDDVFTQAAGNGIRRQSAPQIPFQPSAGNRPHSHPAGQRQPKQTIHLWQFLKELLEDPDNYHGCIKWTDRSRGIFKIEDSSRVARLWGRRKNRPAMNYDKLSRSVRQYYKKGIIKKTEHSKRLVYQFCPPYL